MGWDQYKCQVECRANPWTCTTHLCGVRWHIYIHHCKRLLDQINVTTPSSEGESVERTDWREMTQQILAEDTRSSRRELLHFDRVQYSNRVIWPRPRKFQSKYLPTNPRPHPHSNVELSGHEGLGYGTERRCQRSEHYDAMPCTPTVQGVRGVTIP